MQEKKVSKTQYKAEKAEMKAEVTKYKQQRYVKPIRETDDVIELARANTPDAMYTIYSLMIDEQVAPSVRLKAAEAILNRGWGTPVRSVHVQGQIEHKAVHEMSRAELVQIIERAKRQEGLPSENTENKILEAEFIDK